MENIDPIRQRYVVCAGGVKQRWLRSQARSLMLNHHRVRARTREDREWSWTSSAVIDRWYWEWYVWWPKERAWWKWPRDGGLVS